MTMREQRQRLGHERKASMKRKFIVLLVLQTILACNEEVEFPVNLDIKGLPPSSFEGIVLENQYQNHALLLRIKAGQAIFEVRLSPWLERWAKALEGVDRLKADVFFLPDGPFQRLEISRDNKPVMVIGNEIRSGAEVLPGWKLAAGGPLAIKGRGGKAWAAVKLSGPGKELVAGPGMPVVLESRAGKHVFVLIGARIPALRGEVPLSPPQDKGIAPAGDRGEISRQDPKFTADWILFPAQF